LALLVSVPALWLLGPTFESSTAATASLEGLRVLGDRRPHNVFADEAITEVFTFTVRSVDGKVLPVLLDEAGERVGDLRDIRVFMEWFRLGRAAGHAWLAHQETWIDQAELVSHLELRLDSALREGNLDRGEVVTVDFQAWRIDADGGDVKTGGPQRICVVTVGTARHHQVDCSP
jgi:hypothetical protein